jgi:GNAT superfamily N-acetyltransferase
MRVRVRTAEPPDVDVLATAFESWPKPPELFADYLSRQASGEFELLVAHVAPALAGYCLVSWSSTYPPFAADGVPEVVDLNVVADQRRRGVGRQLLKSAEELISARSRIAGLRVGLYADYGPAQQMYVRYGYVPDGRGLSVRGRLVPPGSILLLDDDAVIALTRELP